MAFLYVAVYAVIGLILGALLWGIEDEEDAVGWMLLWPWFTLICVVEAVAVVLHVMIKVIRRELRRKSRKNYRNNQNICQKRSDKKKIRHII